MKAMLQRRRPRGAEQGPLRKPALAIAALALAAFSSAPAPAATTLRPIVSIETDPTGAANVRVAEQVYSAFTPAVTVQNLTDDRIDILSDVPILISNVRGGASRYGISIANHSAVSIDRYRFVNWEGQGSIYGGAIKLDRTGVAPTYVQRVFADAQASPDPSYDICNTDFIGVERNATPLYVRGATGRNFGDGGVDAKSNVYLMNVSIQNVHRGLRVWSNSRITIANSIINVPAGQQHVWLYDSTSSVRYYNVLWCVGATNPSPSDPACGTSPTVVSGDKISSTQARAQIVALSTNPLPALSNFFRTQIDRIVIEYSRDAGRTWHAMASGGSTGRPPLGDTRYRVPFSLSGYSYLFRVHFERNGARVGSSVVVSETGQTVA